MKFLSVILLIFCLQTYAVTEPPQLLRACINSKEFTVTLSWQPPTDDCGSFTKYCVFASFNSGPFNKVATIPSLVINEYPHSISSISTDWRYYVTVYNLCNGVDSANSSILSIDDLYPTNIQLDSVSYDLATQDIIAGWAANPSIDTKGYKIYDFSSGNGDSIGFTANTFQVVSPSPARRFPVSIATLDSCLLSSLLSDSHIPAYLQGTIDTCANTISLNWLRYVGWSTIDSQVVFVSKNQQSFIKLALITNLSNSFIYNDFVLGDTIIFYIRSYTKTGSVTSSSNKLSFSTRKRIAPENLYLDNVTVENNKIEISWSQSRHNDAVTFQLFMGENTVDKTLAYTEPINILFVDFKYIDYTNNPNQKTIFYSIRSLDNCGSTLDSTELSSNIKLEITPNLSHNNYNNWDGGVFSYELLHKENPSSTWNTLETNNTIITKNSFSPTTGCYVIRATEQTNKYGKSAVSYSNLRCKTDSLEAYIPTGINPNSENSRFVVEGKGIDHSKSSYQIYNRWGELIAQNNTNVAWDLKYKNDIILPGLYIYIVDLYGVLGEKRTEKGTIYVLR